MTTEAGRRAYAGLTANVPDVATLTVTFNGTEYSCLKLNDGVNGYAYGAPYNGNTDFSNYPFRIEYFANESKTYIFTSSSGTYSLKIESAQNGVIYDGSVTTRLLGYYEWSPLLISDSPSIKVTFDGTEYICPQICREENGNSFYYYYGGYDCESGYDDFSEYPFYLCMVNYGDTGYAEITVESSGEHSLKVETLDEAVETSECFEEAVRSVVGGSAKFVVTDDGNSVASATPVEIQQALDEGKVVEFHQDVSSGIYVYQLSSSSDNSAHFISFEGGSSSITLYNVRIDNNGAITTNSITISQS